MPAQGNVAQSESTGGVRTWLKPRSDIYPPALAPTQLPSLANLLTQLRTGLMPVKQGINHLLHIQKRLHPKACCRVPLQAKRRSVAVREDLTVPWMESDAMLGP